MLLWFSILIPIESNTDFLTKQQQYFSFGDGSHLLLPCVRPVQAIKQSKKERGGVTFHALLTRGKQEEEMCQK